MRLALAAALAALAPAAVRAADTPVDLKAGHDYALGLQTRGNDTVQLIGPGGTVVVSRTEDTGFYQDAVEFRAPYTATYLVRAPAGDGAWVDPDCPGGTRTRCHLSVNHTRRGVFTGGLDRDWFAVKLSAGRRYAVSYASPGGIQPATIAVMSGGGKALASADMPAGSGTLAFRPRASGDYFIAVGNDDGDFGGTYTLGLR